MNSPGIRPDACGVSLDHWVTGFELGPDAGRSIRFTRNMGTVKATYWGLVFFWSFLVVGVSHSLGFPSGGLYRWQTNGLDG